MMLLHGRRDSQILFESLSFEMKRGIVLTMLFLSSALFGQERTLRLDYIFSGTASDQRISLDEISCMDGWAGRRVNADSVCVRGNGQILMKDPVSEQVLYRHSFSTLFQEWQTTEEAVDLTRAFENVFLLPMPDDEVVVEVELYGFHGGISSSLSHAVDPSDILIRRIEAEPAPHRYIHKSGAPSDCIDVAIVAEGYTEEEREHFYEDAMSAVEAVLGHEPFGSMGNCFNFVAVALPSEESGVSVPGKGQWKKTALSSHFDTFHMERYLTTLRIRQLHDSLAGIPYEHIIILANTDTYGGGGIYGSYALSAAGHSAFRQVVVHEFGHSFAGLADEYHYDDQYSQYYFPDCEPWEPNITTLYDFQSKWDDMLPKVIGIPTAPVSGNIWEMLQEGRTQESLIGVYEGAGYQSKGVYRPYPDCRMHTNKAEMFCPICRRAIARMIDYHLR